MKKLETDQKLLSLARLQQIKQELIRLEKKESADLKSLSGAGAEAKANYARAEKGYLMERLELYNEKAQIESMLVHTGAEAPVRAATNIKALAKRLDLGTKLRQSRQLEIKARSCWTNCVECITSCTECVTACTSSVSGSQCIGNSLVAAPCNPKPNVFEKMI